MRPEGNGHSPELAAALVSGNGHAPAPAPGRAVDLPAAEPET